MLLLKIWLIKAVAGYAIWSFIGKARQRDVKDWAWRLFGFHDSYGLKYSRKHLQAAFEHIHLMPIAKQARYADKIIKDLVRDRLETRTMLDGAFRHFATFNTTSVGNLAYLALNSYDKRVKDQSIKILHDFNQYRIREGKLKTVKTLVGVIGQLQKRNR